MMFKDACNRKSNQRHLGTIRGSNLCTEIVEYTSPDEVAVCNLASINLTAMVVDDAFDFKKLRKISNVVTRNLNKVIDVNYYPARRRVPSCRGAFTPSTRVVSRNDGSGWFLFRF